MVTISRTRTVAHDPALIWAVVDDPQRLSEWWPAVSRVEDATPEAWTTVMTSASGRTLRADFTLVAAEPPERRVWRQEVEESPFERILSEAETTLELEPAEDETLVRLTARLRLRGFSRLGSFQLRRAWRRQLDGALEGLDDLLAGGAPA